MQSGPPLSAADKLIAVGANLMGYSVLFMFGYFLVLMPAARIAGIAD